MPLKYATGITAATSSYYFKNYQNLSATTYQNQKIARMSEVSNYFNFCTGATSMFIPQTQMGTRYATINNAYYKPMYTYPWHNGDIDYFTITGFTVTCASSIPICLHNNVYTNAEYNVSLWAVEVGGGTEYPLLMQYFNLTQGEETTIYYYNGQNPPEGEIGSLKLMIYESNGINYNMSTSITTAGMGTIWINGQTSREEEEYLSNNVEIQEIFIQVSL